MRRGNTRLASAFPLERKMKKLTFALVLTNWVTLSSLGTWSDGN